MIKISEKYAIDFDSRNIILQERYEKRSGVGKNAPLSGEFAYRDVNYHNNMNSVAESLKHLDVSESEVERFEAWATRLEKLKDEIADLLSIHIDIDAEKKKVEEARARKG